MFAGWMLMLTAGNLGHVFDDPRWFVSYWTCVPFGILIDVWLLFRAPHLVWGGGQEVGRGPAGPRAGCVRRPCPGRARPGRPARAWAPEVRRAGRRPGSRR